MRKHAAACVTVKLGNWGKIRQVTRLMKAKQTVLSQSGMFKLDNLWIPTFPAIPGKPSARQSSFNRNRRLLIFSRHTSYLARIVFLLPLSYLYHSLSLPSLLIFSLSLFLVLGCCSALLWQPHLACCHGHMRTETHADVLKLGQIQHGGEAVAVSWRSDWTRHGREGKQTTVSWPLYPASM